MITFQKLRWKNFLSTGNNFTEVDFTRNPTTLIVGENGSGKSTVLDALCFGLFNKPFRNINKPQLVNSINGKKMLVEIEFQVGDKQYKVVRGIKPNVFEIYCNDKFLDQDAALRDTQKYLEESILKLNYKSLLRLSFWVVPLSPPSCSYLLLPVEKLSKTFSTYKFLPP